MKKTNLETELKKSKSVVFAKELLQIKEYDKFLEIKSTALERVGLLDNIKEGGEKKNILVEGLGVLDTENIFHISQIKKICQKYYLRFLPAHFYKGDIDVELPKKIDGFEIATGINCTKESCFIIAPATSFQLREVPRDPLFLVKIAKDYYYLIYKWGNDLNKRRRVLGWGSKLFGQADTFGGLFVLSIIVTEMILGIFFGFIFAVYMFLPSFIFYAIVFCITRNKIGDNYNDWDVPIKRV